MGGLCQEDRETRLQTMKLGCGWKAFAVVMMVCGIAGAQGRKTITVGGDGGGLYDDSGGGECGSG